MDLHSKMTMYLTSTMTCPVTKTAKTSKWLRLQERDKKNLIFDQHIALCLVNEGSTISFSILCCVENEKLWVLMSSFHVRSLMHSTLLEDPVFV